MITTRRPQGRGAAYVRVSDITQELDRQNVNIQEWAQRHGTVTLETYQDHGRRHLSDRRADFQRLLKDVERGRWDWVVVDSQDRLGFKDPYEYYHFIHVFRQNSVELWSATGNVLLSADDTAGILTTGVGAIGSRDEMVKKSQRDIGKKRVMAAVGEYTGGWCAYGCDIVAYEGDREVWRVIAVGKWERLKKYPDGSEERWDGKDNSPPKGRNQRLALAPSVFPGRVQTLQDMFQWADEGESLNGIAKRLNAQGRYHVHGPWYAVLVKGILVNSAAIGRPAWNKRSSGVYSELGADGITAPSGKRCRKRDKNDHIQPDTAIFAPMVDPDQYNRVQDLLEGRAPKPRKPRSDGLTLAGILWCGRCNTVLCGWHANDKWGDSYACSSYRRFGTHNPHGCRLHRVPHSRMIQILDHYLAETEVASKELATADDRDLLPLLYKSKRLRERLGSLRGEMEMYLVKHLADVAQVTPLEDGRNRFTVPTFEGPITLDLPNADNPAAIQEVFAWLNHGRRGRVAGRITELRTRLETLVRSYHELPAMARQIVARDIEKIESELAGLQGDDLDIMAQVREAFRELIASERAVSRARIEKRADKKGELIRKVVERVVCWYSYSTHGAQERSHLERVEIYPLTGSDVVEVRADKTFAMESVPVRG